MRYRRVATFVIGLWIGASLFMGFVAIRSLLSVDRILSLPSPGTSKIVERLGAADARAFLKYYASELNRDYFSQWEVTQMGLAVVLAGVLFLGTHSRMLAIPAGVMLVLVCFEHWVLTPEVTWLGRQFDYAPGGPSRRFWLIHALYVGIDLLKILTGAGLAIYMFSYKSRTKAPSSESRTASVANAGR